MESPVYSGSTYEDYAMTKSEKIHKFYGLDSEVHYPDGLSAHKDDPDTKTLEEFVEALRETGYAGINLDTVYEKVGIKYIVDPTNPDYVIDMQHVCVAGQFSVLGPLAGDYVEDNQGVSTSTGGDPQDYYSNAIGAWLARRLLFEPSTDDIADQIYNHLKNHPR